jgi:hypothetical protein
LHHQHPQYLANSRNYFQVSLHEYVHAYTCRGTLRSTVSQQRTIQFGTKPINERWALLLKQYINVGYRLSFAGQGKHTSVFRLPLVPFSVYIYILKGPHIRIFIYISTLYISSICCSFKRKTENGSPGDFLKSVYYLPIVQTEVCRLSFCLFLRARSLQYSYKSNTQVTSYKQVYRFICSMNTGKKIASTSLLSP